MWKGGKGKGGGLGREGEFGKFQIFSIDIAILGISFTCRA